MGKQASTLGRKRGGIRILSIRLLRSFGGASRGGVGAAGDGRCLLWGGGDCAGPFAQGKPHVNPPNSESFPFSLWIAVYESTNSLDLIKSSSASLALAAAELLGVSVLSRPQETASLVGMIRELKSPRKMESFGTC